MPESSNEMVEPGTYTYALTVKFPSVYIPEHTPPQFRNTDAYETTRTRWASGEFDLGKRAPRDALRAHFVREVCEDVSLDLVSVTRFDLTRITA